jgi:Kyakuja-Dileera-Zisupton transposase
MATKACDITGIAALACARHGCFVPNTFGDMYRGEQQKNIDFILLRAIKILGLDPAQGLFFVYDIVCQYIIHIHKRIGNHLPDGLTIEKAIDLFHVHCHKDQCFFRYATTFIPGAAVVAGQILESLWSTLNTISPKVRTASLAHRAEILDDHACDSNNKKLLGMTETLRIKFHDANDMVTQADEYYSKIVQNIEPVTLMLWDEEIRQAEIDRIDDITAMDIYQARIHSQSMSAAGKEADTARHRTNMGPAFNSVSSTVSGSAPTPQEHWMEFAILVEETQLVYFA